MRNVSYKRVAEGIRRYQTKDGSYRYELKWPGAQGGKPVYETVREEDWQDAHGIFSLKRLKDYRERQLGGARERRTDDDSALGSLARRVAAWLAARKKRNYPGYRAQRSHLRVWLPDFHGEPLSAITLDRIKKILARWQYEENAHTGRPITRKTAKDRLQVLKQFWLDVEPQRLCPVGDIKRLLATWKKSTAADHQSHRHDIATPELIVTILETLRDQELNGKLRDAKTRARTMLFAATGIRPTQIADTLPVDFDFTPGTEVWHAPPGKCDHGTDVPLRGDLLIAAQFFVEADGFSDHNGKTILNRFDTANLRKVLQRNGWPKTDPRLDPDYRLHGPYAMRRAITTAMKKQGAVDAQIGVYTGHVAQGMIPQHYTSDGVKPAGVADAMADLVATRLNLAAHPKAIDLTPVVRKSYKGRRHAAARAEQAAPASVA